jgi:hypothetical protein
MTAHGTETCYVNRGCQLPQCRAAATEARAVRRRAAAYREWGAEPDWVDADEVREHVAVLRAAGMTEKHITAAAGLPEGALRNVLYRQQGQPLSKRVRRRTAEAVLSVTAPSEPAADWVLVDASGTRRRLQALAALGWSWQAVGEHAGYTSDHVRWLTKQPHVAAGAARRITVVYDKLSMHFPADCLAVRRTKSRAEKRGWLPPLAWDDDLIDLPDNELAAELQRQVDAMTDEERAACYQDRYHRGGRSPLTDAAAIEHGRRYRESRGA